MARMYKATNDTAILEKASCLIDEWAKTMDPNGYFYYSRKPQFPHYIYEKIVCGLVDMYAYGDNKNAIRYLERITAWAEKNLDRTRRNPRDGERGFSADGTEWYTLSENLYRAYQLTVDPRYKNFGDLWHYDNYWSLFNTPNPRPDYRHAYSHCNTLSSAAMTYAVTSDPKYLRHDCQGTRLVPAHPGLRYRGIWPGRTPDATRRQPRRFPGYGFRDV